MNNNLVMLCMLLYGMSIRGSESLEKIGTLIFNEQLIQTHPTMAGLAMAGYYTYYCAYKYIKGHQHIPNHQDSILYKDDNGKTKVIDTINAPHYLPLIKIGSEQTQLGNDAAKIITTHLMPYIPHNAPELKLVYNPFTDPGSTIATNPFIIDREPRIQNHYGACGFETRWNYSVGYFNKYVYMHNKLLFFNNLLYSQGSCGPAHNYINCCQNVPKELIDGPNDKGTAIVIRNNSKKSIVAYRDAPPSMLDVPLLMYQAFMSVITPSRNPNSTFSGKLPSGDRPMCFTLHSQANRLIYAALHKPACTKNTNASLYLLAISLCQLSLNTSHVAELKRQDQINIFHINPLYFKKMVDLTCINTPGDIDKPLLVLGLTDDKKMYIIGKNKSTHRYELYEQKGLTNIEDFTVHPSSSRHFIFTRWAEDTGKQLNIYCATLGHTSEDGKCLYKKIHSYTLPFTTDDNSSIRVNEKIYRCKDREGRSEIFSPEHSLWWNNDGVYIYFKSIFSPVGSEYLFRPLITIT